MTPAVCLDPAKAQKNLIRTPNLLRNHAQRRASAGKLCPGRYPASYSRLVQRILREETCPVRSLDPKRLPEVPIIFVDMPWVQSTLGQGRVERLPRWHNPGEQEAVATAVKLLRAEPSLEKAPSLAILSPYGEQVRRLKTLIDERVDEYPELK